MALPDQRLADPDARRQHALDLACRFLDRRDRTVAEVRRYLDGKRVEPATITETLEELTARRRKRAFVCAARPLVLRSAARSQRARSGTKDQQISHLLTFSDGHSTPPTSEAGSPARPPTPPPKPDFLAAA